ncbi:antibiotic biosynthesis monooxygenase family protein [Chloroflexota bacterium]
MFSRVTLFEIDTMQISVSSALEQFKGSVVPEMRKQEGYEGAYVMSTAEGKGLIMSLWKNEEAAKAGLESGYYDNQIAKFVAIFHAPAGREHYQVIFADIPETGNL